jgi:hypothetical protein
MGNRARTDFLFAQPSFLSGAASVVDLWGQFHEYNESATPGEADATALFSDWCVVGQDISAAMEQHATDGKQV